MTFFFDAHTGAPEPFNHLLPHDRNSMLTNPIANEDVVSKPGHAAPSQRVVLVPCSAGTSRQWRSLIDELNGFDPIRFDLSGHGDRSGWHGDGPLSLMQEAAAISDACPGSTPFHLVGHSYGGAVALKFALCYPERLLSLTLVEPSCFHLLNGSDDANAPLLEEVLRVADTVNRAVLCGDYRGGMAAFVYYWAGPDSWVCMPDSKKARLADLALHVAHHFWGLIHERTPLSGYAAIGIPTLILCGTRSPAPSRTVAGMLAEALPCARHRILPNAGHMSPITHPAQVNPLIVGHILSNSPSSNLPPPLTCRRSRRVLCKQQKPRGDPS
jgi:pimeloyl-ACP methyl ester carboxylesterase